MSSFLRAFSVAAGLWAIAMPASAAIMTFNDVNLDPFADIYFEDGILATGIGGSANLGMYSEGAVHIDDYGTSAPEAVSFTMASRFNAVSFDLSPSGFDFFVYYEDRSYSEPTYKNVYVQGFQGETQVANLTFDMSYASGRIELGGEFKNLTSLLIGAALPDFNYYEALPGVSYIDCAAPCSHFSIDNVVLAPVPLPAGLPLAASGIGLLALISRRRKGQAADKA